MVKCKTCNDHGIAIIQKEIDGYKYDYAFICDCWEGVAKKENYPRLKDKNNVEYLSKR